MATPNQHKGRPVAVATRQAAPKKAARELKGLRLVARSHAVRRSSPPIWCCGCICCIGG
jgi:hypothetical protein